MLYTRHDIPNRADIIANTITSQLEGPPYLSPSNRADKQVLANLFYLSMLCAFLYIVHEKITGTIEGC